MLFRKKIERSCAYCTFGTVLEDGQVLCMKKGIRNIDDKCRKFRYEPCKRIPAKAKAVDFSRYEETDYTL